MPSNNFSLRRTGQVVTATPTGAAVEIDTAPGPGKPANDDVIVYNPGPELVRVIVGDASVVAHNTTPVCQPILPGEKGAWSKGSATHLAAWVASGTQDIELFVGSGQ